MRIRCADRLFASRCFAGHRSVLRCSRGFTMVEILVSMSISVLVLATIYMLFFSSNRILDTTGAQSDIIDDLRLLMDRMVRELRHTKKIVQVTPSKISFEMFDPADLGIFGVVGTKRVSYAHEENKGGGHHIIRGEGAFEEKNLIKTFVDISEEIFYPYVEKTGSFGFVPFDWKVNFNEDRERISYIRIRLRATDRRNPQIQMEVISGVCLRHIHERLSQPFWNYSVE